jgi:hypothetical protein
MIIESYAVATLICCPLIFFTSTTQRFLSRARFSGKLMIFDIFKQDLALSFYPFRTYLVYADKPGSYGSMSIANFKRRNK